MNSTSISLLDRARVDTESDAWRELTAIYTPLLTQWMRRFQLQAADIDDLLQEVLLTVARELPAFQHTGQIGAFRSWIKTILTHRLSNHWRSRRYRPTTKGGRSVLDELQSLEDAHSRISQIWEAEHDRHVLAKLLASLRGRFQQNTWEAFRRQMLDGEPADSVAAALNMPIHSVYVAKSRVLNALRSEAEGLVDSVLSG